MIFEGVGKGDGFYVVPCNISLRTFGHYLDLEYSSVSFFRVVHVSLFLFLVTSELSSLV